MIILIKCVTFASFHFCSISRNKNRERKMKPGVGINQNFLGYPLQPFVTKPGYRFSLLTKLRKPSRPSASTPFTGVTLCDFIILLISIWRFWRKISTNRSPVSHSRVGWSRGSSKKQFMATSWKCSCVIGRNQPTRLWGTIVRWVDIFKNKKKMKILLSIFVSFHVTEIEKRKLEMTQIWLSTVGATKVFKPIGIFS